METETEYTVRMFFKVLYNLGFKSSMTKSKKARLLPLHNSMLTSTKNNHAWLLLDLMKPRKRFENQVSSEHMLRKVK